MNTLTQSHELLAAYSQTIGPEGLRLDAHGCARLVFGEAIAVDIEIDRTAGCLQLYGVLGPVPVAGREELYRKLLEGNLFGSQTQGAWLAIDNVQEEVLLCRRVDVFATSALEFGKIVESFAGTLGHWLQLWHEGRLVDALATPPATSMASYIRG